MNRNLTNYSKWFGNEFKNSFKSLFKKGERVKQIPNVLTFSRALAPFVVAPVALTGNLVAALVLAILFAATDAIDGQLARRLNAVSDFGKDLDPFCDKIYAAGIGLPIVMIHPVILAPLAFEVIISVTNIISKAKGNTPTTTFVGKVKTVVGAALIITLYATTSYVINPSIILGLFAATLALQAYTAVDYIKIHLEKENVKKNVNAIVVNREPNPEMEKIEERRRKKVKTLGERKKGPIFDKTLDMEKYTTADLCKLRDEVVAKKEENLEVVKQIKIGINPEAKRNS